MHDIARGPCASGTRPLPGVSELSSDMSDGPHVAKVESTKQTLDALPRQRRCEP